MICLAGVNEGKGVSTKFCPPSRRSVQLSFSALGDDWNLSHPELLLPPRPILEIPLDRPVEAVLERDFRTPAKQAFGLAPIGRVPEHLPGSISDVGNEALGLVHAPYDDWCDLGERQALAVTEIDDFSLHFLQIAVRQAVERATGVLDEGE